MPPPLRDGRTVRTSRADAGQRSPVLSCGRSCGARRRRWKVEQMIAQRLPDLCCDRLGIGIRVDQHAALRILSGNLLVGFAQVLVKLEIFRLETVRRALAAPRCRALHADLDGDVENDG